MATDVTVNIRGDASQLRDELDNTGGGRSPVNPPPQPTVPPNGGNNPPPNIPIPNPTSPQPSSGGSGRGGIVPSSDRMVEDVRREMQQRGVLMIPGSSSMHQIINQYGQNARQEVNDKISDKYGQRRDDLQNRAALDYQEIEDDIAAKRASGIQRLGVHGNDPMYLSILEKQLQADSDRQYRTTGQRIDDEYDEIDKEESAERAEAEIELTNAIKALTEHFERKSESGDSQDSYIGRLREQQKKFIQERDSADTEEGAMGASRSLAEVNEKLRRAMGGGQPQQGVGLNLLQKSAGSIGMMNSLQSGDVGGTIVGGAVMTGNPYAIGGAIAIAALEKTFKTGSNVSEGFSSLGSLRSTNPNGIGGEDARSYLLNTVPDKSYDGKSYTDLGLDSKEFSNRAFQTSKTRGTTDDWYNETFRQIGLEKGFALKEGDLKEGSKYDRYGTNVTEGLSRLVTILNGISGSGVSFNDFTRVQEKFDIQQQIMGSYMSRSDKPNYDTANRTLSAFSSVSGVTQDSRVGDAIGAFQSMIQNPKNDRMKSLIIGAVGDIMPELVDENGNNYSKSDSRRMDKIDWAIENPENESKIISAVVQRMTQMYGGTDTKMGYFNVKNLLDTLPADQRAKYWEALGNPNSQASKILNKEGEVMTNLNKASEGNMEFWTKEAVGHLTDMSKLLNKLVDVTTTKPAQWVTPWNAQSKLGSKP